MIEQIKDLFTDEKLITKIQRRLPELFILAEVESSRAGKMGMEVGTIRERIIIALLIYKFGEQNVRTDIPITKSEIDVYLFDKPISIKTITSNTLKGIKLSWTVDAEKALAFSQNYKPTSDIILVQINWNSSGGLFYIPLEVQLKVLKEHRVDKYIKLPKAGTNPRGIEMHGDAMQLLIADKRTLQVPINWTRNVVILFMYRAKELLLNIVALHSCAANLYAANFAYISQNSNYGIYNKKLFKLW